MTTPPRPARPQRPSWSLVTSLVHIVLVSACLGVSVDCLVHAADQYELVTYCAVSSCLVVALLWFGWPVFQLVSDTDIDTDTDTDTITQGRR